MEKRLEGTIVHVSRVFEMGVWLAVLFYSTLFCSISENSTTYPYQEFQAREVAHGSHVFPAPLLRCYGESVYWAI